MKPEFRMIDTNGIKLRAAVQGEGPLVVMVHGFPESWYSWRHQMAPLAAAGFTACAIDVRGYGGSDKPHAVEAYAIKEIAADVAGVIDALSPGKPAVLIGHDWGAPIVWHTAVLHPKQVRAVAGLSVPWFGLPPMSLDAADQGDVHRSGQVLLSSLFQGRRRRRSGVRSGCARRIAQALLRRQRRFSKAIGAASTKSTAMRCSTACPIRNRSRLG